MVKANCRFADDTPAVRKADAAVAKAAAPPPAKPAAKKGRAAAAARPPHTSAHFKPDPASACAACRGRHRKHTCGRVALVQAPKAGCPACRGRHRAHTCGLRS